ncbi:MAG TPA: cytochrome c oxidase assembly protein [Gammaproteobacteria bacterium]|nr:cytochrome c oxidase assembly protein [Gammaproteobacteria bacterium]
MRRLILFLIGLAVAAPAAAHGVGVAGEPLHWAWEPWALLCMALASIAYLVGLYRMGAEGRRRLLGPFRPVSFFAGILVLLFAVEYPLDALEHALFSAHMVEQLLLLLIAPPLLVAGRPVVTWMWAFDLRSQSRIARGWHRLGLYAAFEWLARPMVSWLFMVAVLCFWHFPGPYDWALQHEWLHDIERLSFLGAAVGYWTIVTELYGRRRALGYGATMIYVVSIGFVMALIAAILTLAPHALYAAHFHTTQAYGLTPLQDQHIAGAIMWIPSNMIHLVTLCALFYAWMREDKNGANRVRTMIPTAAVRCVVIVPLVLIGLSGCGGGSNDNGNDQNGITTIQLNSQSNVSASVNAAVAPKDAEPWETIPGADPQRGAKLISHFGCGGCHTIPGIGNANGIVGPPLTRWSDRMIIAGFMRNRPSNLIPWIQNPQAILPGVDMPNMGITRKQAEDIAAYLYTLD